MIDLRSDTVTKPSEAMREAARNATVGDDVHREDPTVMELEERAAEILGMDAALYVASGTMGNQVAVLTHTTPGQEVILESNCHIYNWECGGLATNGGIQARPLDGGATGLFSIEQLDDAFVEESLHRAGTGLVCIENTHNHAGGVPHSPDAITARAEIAHDHGVALHIDGARLWNAAVSLEVDPRELVEPVDSVMVALTKGLGAPVGSILAGSSSFIAQARRQRKRLGGGMRQAGIIAAPGLLALEQRDHLPADHERARRLANALDELDGLSVATPETNIIVAEVTQADRGVEAFLTACEHNGVRGIAFGENTVRFCTHLDIDDSDIDIAIDAISAAIEP